MFKINSDQSIHLTRGDVAAIDVSAKQSNSDLYVFKKGDVIRMQVFVKAACNKVVLKKDVTITESTSVVTISLSKEDTTIGNVIHKPVDYWYEIELNPTTSPQTLVGYDDNGAKILRLYPEGSDLI